MRGAKNGCGRFHEILDVSIGKDPDPGLLTELAEHASVCEECRLVLEIHGHLSGPDDEKLVSEAAESTGGGMWDRVCEAVNSRSSSMPVRRRPFTYGRTTGLLTAAVVLLAVVSTVLLSEVSRLRRTTDGLERELSVLAASRPGPARDRSGPGSYITETGMAWSIRAALDSGITVGDFADMLKRLAPGETLIKASDIPGARYGAWPVGASMAGGGTGIDLSDGLQAGEVSSLLDSAGVDPDTRITRRLIEDLCRRCGAVRLLEEMI